MFFRSLLSIFEAMSCVVLSTTVTSSKEAEQMEAYPSVQCKASGWWFLAGVLLEVAGEEACTNRYAPPLCLCRYFDAAVLVSTWPAISLRSFGYSTISIRRFDDRPSSESFEARG